MDGINKSKRIQAVGKFLGKRSGGQPVYWVYCQGCGKEIRSDEDLQEVEYVKTRGGKEIFFHTCCVGRVWGRKSL